MAAEYTGIIRDVIFHNKENGYTVAVFETESEGYPEEFTIVGNIPQAAAGRSLPDAALL